MKSKKKIIKKLIKKKKIKKINKKNNKSLNIKTNKIAICLLGYQPPDELLELYDGLYKGDVYDIYIVVDDNNYDISEQKKRFKDFNFIKVKEETCYKYGYLHLAFTVKKGEPSAWDKGIYYFCEENKINYKYIWFIEDDVFIPLPTSLKDIDDKYEKFGLIDLLLRTNKLFKNNNINIPYSHQEQLNKYMDSKLKPFLSKSMICAIRVSQNLLNKIKLYAEKKNYLFFSEYIFVTLAKYYDLNIKEIDELKNIYFRKIWTIDDIFKEQNTLFHPVKDFTLQKAIRKTLFPNHVYFILNDNLIKQIEKNKDVKLKNKHFLQILIFKNKDNDKIKVIYDTSLKSNILYIEFERIINKNIFKFRLNIKNLEEIKSLLTILKYECIALHNIIKEHYVFKNNINIYIINIPSIIQFVEFESSSEEKLIDAYNYFGYSINDVINLKNIIKKTEKLFGTKIDLNDSFEIEKKNKVIKYIKNNKELFKKLIDKQYKIYKSIINSSKNKIKILNKSNFIIR